MTNSSNDRLFLICMFTGLTVCLGLYLTEAVHFYRYGYGEKNEFYISAWNHPQCRSVNGTSFELDCPVNGYGFSRFWLPPRAQHFIYKERDWEPSRFIYMGKDWEPSHKLAQKDPLTSR